MIAGAFCVQALVWISLTICWGIWMVNANNIDSGFSDACETAKAAMSQTMLDQSNLPSCDISIYDVAWRLGPWPDDLSESLVEDAEDYCDIWNGSEIDWDNECVEKGIRWSVAYKFCFALCLIYLLASVVLMGGAWNYHSRVLGGCTFCCA